MKRTILAAMILLSACAPRAHRIDLVNGAEEVKVFHKTDPPKECRELGTFTAASGSGCGIFGTTGSYESTYNAFRNSVVAMGGNVGMLDVEIPSHSEYRCYVNAYVMRGVAYKCGGEEAKQ